jgi:hypothetical protein
MNDIWQKQAGWYKLLVQKEEDVNSIIVRSTIHVSEWATRWQKPIGHKSEHIKHGFGRTTDIVIVNKTIKFQAQKPKPTLKRTMGQC